MAKDFSVPVVHPHPKSYRVSPQDTCFMGQREGGGGCCLAVDACEVLCFFIHQMDELDCENFNFEQFYQLYLKVCGRLEIEHLCFKW